MMRGSGWLVGWTLAAACGGGAAGPGAPGADGPGADGPGADGPGADGPGAIAPDTGSVLDLPGHSECLPVGQRMDADTCLAVVAFDDRMPTASWYKAGPAAPPDPDPRLTDPEYAWLRSEIERCTCTCCHTAAYGGPGVHQWDLDFAPMWIDSASGWSLDVLSGEVESENQFLPTDDVPRMRAVITRELDRRDAANDALRAAGR